MICGRRNELRALRTFEARGQVVLHFCFRKGAHSLAPGALAGRSNPVGCWHFAVALYPSASETMLDRPRSLRVPKGRSEISATLKKPCAFRRCVLARRHRRLLYPSGPYPTPKAGQAPLQKNRVLQKCKSQSSETGQTLLGTDRYHSMVREKGVTVYRSIPSSALDYFGLITISKWATPSGLATSPPLFD